MRGIKRPWLLAGLALLLAACGGGAPPQDLTLSAVSPDSPTVPQGGSLTLTLTFTSQNGFQGQVSLSVTKDGQPPSWLSLSPTSKSLNVPKGGQVQETLQVQVAGNAPTGPHALKLRATYGDKTAERNLTLTVNPPPSFALSLDPTSLTVQQGGSNTTTLTVTPQNGFTGTVSLALVAGQEGVPQGLTLSPQSLQVTGSGPVTQTLTLSTSPSTPTGTYRLKVRGTSGSLTREADLTVTVSAPSGGGGGGGNTGSAGGVQVNLQGGTFTQGPTAQNVSPPQGFQAPYGAIAFTAQVPQGGTLTVTLTFPNTIPQGAVLKKYLNNAWQDIPGAQLSGSTATYQVQDGGALDGDGQQNGQVVDPVALLTPEPSYTLSDPSPNPLPVSSGSTATFQVTLTSQNGFQGQVTLSLVEGQDPLPQGLAITATNPSPISLQAGGSVTVTATVSAGQGVDPGTYRLKVRAEGGNVVQEKPLSVRVQPPVEVNPSLLEVQMSSSGYYGTLSGSATFQLFVRPSSNLSGTVTLRLRGANGESVGGLGLNPSSVYVDPQRENSYSITLSVTSGSAGEDVAQFWVPGDNALRLRLSAGQTVQEVPIILRVVASPPGLVWSGRYLSDWGVRVTPDPIAGDSQGNVFGAFASKNDNNLYSPFIPYILGLAPDGKILARFPLEGITIPWNYPVGPLQDIAMDSQGNIYVMVSTRAEGRDVLILRKVSQSGETFWEVPIDPAAQAWNHRRSRVAVGPGGRVYLSYNLDPQDIPPYGVVEARDAATGDLIWRREFVAIRTTPPDYQGNTTTYRVETFAQNGLRVGPDGSVYVAGEAEGNLFDSLYGPSYPGDSVSGSGWVAKLSPTDGSVVWGKQFIGQLPPPYTGAVDLVDIALTPDGSRLYVVGGTSMNFPPYTNQGYGDGLLMVYDAQTGTLLDYKLYGGPSSDGLGGLGFTPDGRYVYLVYTSRFPTVMKVSTDTLDLQNPVWTYRAGEAQWGVWRVPFVVSGPTGEFVYVPFHLTGESGLHRILP